MNRLCVIGDPIEHSLSPAMHNAGFRHLGIQGRFIFEKHRVSSEELPEFMKRMRAGEFAGLAVTTPHKKNIIPLLDSLSSVAELAGAVNTVLNVGGSLVGHNTDGLGCTEALEVAGVPIEGKKIVLLGAGGTATAIAMSLAQKKPRIFIVNRTMRNAMDLAIAVRKNSLSYVEALGLDFIEKALDGADIVINATSVWPWESLVPVELIKPEMTVFDIVYGTEETQLLKDAWEAGARTIQGTEMLLHQGALQFILFTGKEIAPIKIMRAALEENNEAGH